MGRINIRILQDKTYLWEKVTLLLLQYLGSPEINGTNTLHIELLQGIGSQDYVV